MVGGMRWMEMRTFAVKHKDDEIILKSRSGGVFTALSDLVLSCGGVVYGCVLNEKLEVVHIRGNDKNARDLMRGSKYVQSNLGECFKMVKEDLLQDKMVLFTGTSCQVTGLKCFLHKEYKNLICVDIVCHGVVSPLVWEKYLEYQGGVTSVDFRNKIDFGWHDHVETLIKDGKKINSRVFARIFYSGNALRPSCYKCPFKSIHHPGDITIGDCWGVEKLGLDWDINKGISLVLINTDKGNRFFCKCKSDIIYKEIDINKVMQRAFIKPEGIPKTRDRFWNDFRIKKFSYIVKKYTSKPSCIKRACVVLKNFVYRIFMRR